MLRRLFFETVKKYTAADQPAAEYWDEIVKMYSAPGRFYHCLSHLENMRAALAEAGNIIEDLDTMAFSIFYHDIVYDPSAGDNEEKSAELAAARLRGISVPGSVISLCVSHIISTKCHLAAENNDAALFIDADLAILGSAPGEYLKYSKNVRKEYSMYSEPEYTRGRIKVLKDFLAMARIFKTAFFYDGFETRARENILGELNGLSVKF